MSDSSDIENAVIAKLAADAPLTALMPDGVFFEVAPAGRTRFVIVSLVESHDERVFGGRAVEDVLLLVKAVALSTVTANIKAAAARVDELLDPQPPAAPATLTAAGYSLMAMYRDPDLPRIRLTEEDDDDATIRWFHRGGHYRVVMST
jgi:hypothetical protein